MPPVEYSEMELTDFMFLLLDVRFGTTRFSFVVVLLLVYYEREEFVNRIYRKSFYGFII